MAEKFQLGRGNWWESSTSSRNKFIDNRISSCTTPSASSTALSSMASNFVWPTEIEDIKTSSMVFPADSHKRYASGREGVRRDVDPNLQMMGLGLPSQGLDWNQPFLCERSGSGFRSMVEEGLSSNGNYEQDNHNWSRQKIMYHGNSDDSSSVKDYNKQTLNTLDHQSQGRNLENSGPYYGSPSNMLKGLLISDNSQQESNNFTSASRSLYYNSPYNNSSNDLMPTSSSSWSKFPQFLRKSDPPTQQQLLPVPPHHGQLMHFSGGTPFWNATSAPTDDIPSGFVPSLHPQLPTNPTVDEKPKRTVEIRNRSTTTKKTSSETPNKRPRNESPSPLPVLKVRKEKMGDRITALQQLVSPFGKTDTASVLSEAIEYIKFLHEHVNVLSTPYMKTGGSMQQSGDKYNEGRKQDLRSRGLCLVPVSSTFPVTTVDFWTPTFQQHIYYMNNDFS